MRLENRIGCIIPALDEEQSIGKVVAAIPDWVDVVVVVDNGSRDRTRAVAEAAGARLVSEPERGYGAACLAGIASLAADAIDIVVFMDGDFSDHPGEMYTLVDPIIAGRADMVVGSRVLGKAEPGALTPQQRFGNWLATWLIGMIWGVRYSDLGPFRAIRSECLVSLAMADRNFGWTVEMQIKAARMGYRAIEVPVSYRRRIGVSKISGTVKGTVLAGTRILSLIAREALRDRAYRPTE